MPKDDLNYKFTENGLVYDFYDVFVPAENFRQPSLFTWGTANSGALGTNDITPTRNTPVTTFAGGTTWKQVACGKFATLAIKTDGTLWGWGSNGGFEQKLGINDTGDRSTPVTTFAGGNNWKQVSTSIRSRTVGAIKTDGTLWMWGNNEGGAVGSPNPGALTPVTTFAGGTNWKQISVGGENDAHVAAIKTDGSLWIWGNNSNGQLGMSIGGGNRNTPVTTFAGGNNWKQVYCGEYHTTAIKTDGSLWVWGRNDSGHLGTFDTTQRNTPVTTFAGGNDWKQVSAGRNHTMAIKTDGTLWGWGASGYAVGNNNTSNPNTPVTTFAGGNNWKSVSAGNNITGAIKTDGSLWVWGTGFTPLGIASFGNTKTPITTFAGGNNWKQISVSGYRHSAAIKYQPDP